jgi:hypothetical protein
MAEFEKASDTRNFKKRVIEGEVKQGVTGATDAHKLGSPHHHLRVLLYIRFDACTSCYHRGNVSHCIRITIDS